MANNIRAELARMAKDIASVQPHPRNVRQGDVGAIATSLSTHGQYRPIVVQESTGHILAGNHTYKAALSLGWDKIACIFLEGDDKRAIAYALADNRTMELGYTDDDLLNNLLSTVSDDYITLWDNLGWDEFEIAAIDERATIREVENATGGAYIAPTIVNPLTTQQQEE